MNLQIRDPRAHELARRLAAERKQSITEAVIGALEAELKRQRDRRPLSERLAVLAQDLKQKAGPGGRSLSRDEIDRMWGHS